MQSDWGRDGTQHRRPAPAKVEERARYLQESDLDGREQGGVSEKSRDNHLIFSHTFDYMYGATGIG